MAKKLFAIHGTAKGKKIFESHPAVQVWANDKDDAVRQGALVHRTNPIYNEYYSDGGITAKEHGTNE